MNRGTTLGVTGQRDVKRNGPHRLGDALVELMEAQIAPHRTRFAPVVQAWQQLLTPELLSNCRIEALAGGQLKVVAKSSAHMFELRLCSSEIIKHLAVLCPQARIQRIDIVVG